MAKRTSVDTPRKGRYNRDVGSHSLMNDVLFNIVFGTEKNTPVLRALLNALLGLQGADRIVDLQIIPSSPEKEHCLDKGVVLDLTARDGQQRLFAVEVQVHERPAFTRRVYYYVSRLVSSELIRGDDYDKVPRTISVSLLGFTLFDDRSDLHSRYRLCDLEHGDTLDLVEFHFLELSKFMQHKPHTLRTPLEKWLHILRFGELYESLQGRLPEPLEDEEGIAMAMEAWRDALADESVRLYIEKRRQFDLDASTALHHARREGHNEGKVEGLRLAARKLLDQGMDRETVLRTLGLEPQDLAESP